jgi:hypothetical protein
MVLVLARRGEIGAAHELARTATSEGTAYFFKVLETISRRMARELEEAERLLQGMVEELVSSGEALLGSVECDLAREALALGSSNVLNSGLSLSAGESKGARFTRENWSALAEEAEGRHSEALARFLDAESGWSAFGDPYEQAHALLGQGRCLVGLSRSSEAIPIMQHAREIFEQLRAAPALAETDALLAEAIALSS